jgi:hypothetical protein
MRGEVDGNHIGFNPVFSPAADAALLAFAEAGAALFNSGKDAKMISVD